MGHHRGFHNFRHHYGGLRGSLAWYRLYGRLGLAAVCLTAVLGLWYWSDGTISVNTVSTPKVEAFYWAAITSSQTLGIALGDWMADTGGLGFGGGALVLRGAGDCYWTLLLDEHLAGDAVLGGVQFLTRPLGATVGDFLDKPISDGGLALSRPLASAAIAAFIVLCLLVLPQRPGRHPSRSEELASGQKL